MLSSLYFYLKFIFSQNLKRIKPAILEINLKLTLILVVFESLVKPNSAMF